jgi:hypothetical protein
MRRRSALLMATVTLVASVLAVTGFEQAVAQPGTDPIYRIRITITTTSSTESLYLSGPAWFIDGRTVARTRRIGVGSSFGGFGNGPVSLWQPTGTRHRWVRAVFNVALTPRGAYPLHFTSVKGSRGTSVIRVANFNRGTPVHIRTIRHGRGAGIVRRFSIRTRAVAARGPVSGTAPLPPMVLAHYYPWYTMQTWYQTSFAPYNINDHPYDSSDPTVIARQIQQVQAAGIDGFISSWWGSGSDTDKNLAILWKVLPDTGFKVAVSVNGFSSKFATISGWVRQLRYVLDTYGSRPQYLRVQGEPVIYLWATVYVLRGATWSYNPDYRSVWRRIFHRLRTDGYRFRAVGMYKDNPGDLSVFDGLRTYVTRTPSTDAWTDRKMELVTRAYAAIHGGHRRIWGSGIFPGYDDRQSDRSDPFYLPRNDGALYRAQWADATAADADQALVATFNEWHETTNIEPNRRWGDTYLRITATRASAFRAAR